MSLLFETIRVQNGVMQNLDLHQERVNVSMQKLFPDADVIQLNAEISVPEYASGGIFRCRIDYDQEPRNIQFAPYTPREIFSIQIVRDDTIEYGYKYSDRKRFDELKMSSGAEEVLIVKHGLVTDTSFSNIIFYDGKGWFTPSSPLLHGTRRKQLINQGILKEAHIRPADIGSFQSFLLINAMLEFIPTSASNINCIRPLL